jgi:hypothetical protein
LGRVRSSLVSFLLWAGAAPGRGNEGEGAISYLFFFVFILGFFACFSDRSYLGLLFPLGRRFAWLDGWLFRSAHVVLPVLLKPPDTIYVLQFYREVIDSGFILCGLEEEAGLVCST